MSRRLLFDSLYRLGRPLWDTPPPDELKQSIEGGPGSLRPGHALDVGCGTGTNVMYLARNGWPRRFLGYSPRVTVSDGLAEMVTPS